MAIGFCQIEISGGIKLIGLNKCGLDLKWSDEGAKLIVGENARSEPVDVRTGEKMKDVLMNPEEELPGWFYHMYRDIARKADYEKIIADDLKFCITVWPAFKVAGEYNKTYGHFHSKVPGTDKEYPEVYEVISGNARFIQQANDGSSFIVVDAKEGDKVVVPPSCGHVTVNTGDATLLTLDCSSRSSKSDYGPLKEKQGAMYYDTVEGFVKNERYEKVPELEKDTPKLAKKLGLGGKCIYQEYLDNPSVMDFLKRPQDFMEKFKRD